MTSEPLVSIIINCFNGSTYLRETLDSVLRQTYSNWEVVFWDNRSTDQSATIFSEYHDPRFRYLLADRHTALGEARNLGVAHATGEWLAFLDCDDLWLPNKLELQIEAAYRANVVPAFVYCRTRFYRKTKLGNWVPAGDAPGSLHRADGLPEGDLFERLLEINFINWCSVLVRKDAYVAVGGINPTFRQAEDYDLLLKLARVGHIHAVQQCCCYYRIHQNNISLKQVDLRYTETIQSIAAFPPSESIERALRLHYASYFLHVLLREKKGLKAVALLGRFSPTDLIRWLAKKIGCYRLRSEA